MATLLVQRGTLQVGDAVVAGDAWGKVKALNDYNGKRVTEAGPAVPVEILGFDKPPAAGELLRGSSRTSASPARPRSSARQRLRAEVLAQRTQGGQPRGPVRRRCRRALSRS